MKIAIMGSGNVATALGKGWMKAGHEVVFGVRDSASSKAQKLIQQIPHASMAPIAEAADKADVLVITTPADAVPELIRAMGDVQGKTIIDATNSVRSRPEPYNNAFEALKALAGTERLVKCFNTTGAENMADPDYNTHRLDMFCAGSHTEAKALAQMLATDLGFENCYDFGGDDKVDLLEKFALSWINLAMMQGMGRNIGFKLLKR